MCWAQNGVGTWDGGQVEDRVVARRRRKKIEGISLLLREEMQGNHGFECFRSDWGCVPSPLTVGTLPSPLTVTVGTRPLTVGTRPKSSDSWDTSQVL